MSAQSALEVNTLKNVPLLINGREVCTDITIPVTSPSSHKLIWHASSASLEEVKAAVEAAHTAFPAWSRMKAATKRAIFMKAADAVEFRSQELGTYMEMEIGCLPSFSKAMLKSTSELLRDVAGRINTIVGCIPPTVEEDTSAIVVKEPFGVVLGIAPWNAPYILGLRAILYPLAGGNTCILKGSELCPRSWWALGDVLTKAGLPKGVLNILVHRTEDAAQVTKALIESPEVKKINFTGSTSVGRIIASQAGQNLKPVLLELGGKASAIVLEDANLKDAALQCVIGAFLHAGQICMSSEKILVHKNVKSQFLEVLKATTEAIFGPQTGPPLVAVAPTAIERARQLIDEAVLKGASLIYGDNNKTELHPETGKLSATRIRPIIVEGVTRSMNLYFTETFSPSVSVIEISSDEEAIAIANDTDYGLTASVFTRDLFRGLRIAN
ncbi:salicylaldehyde dehydrogenase [Curvularia clavata]|uniref:Salicylaldehyde dehydrogenase n=1 Tax=Curvularia clavata TaxID=95742 RepID=A0A9Q8ZAN7_CURCL|nr:salicylaldehyde dehydrogenase [Curvularia clavata]